jgi:hypothetical protein
MNNNNFLTGALVGVLIYYIVTHNKQRMKHQRRKMMMQDDLQNQDSEVLADVESEPIVYQDDYGYQEAYYPAFYYNAPHTESFFPNFFENSYGEVIYNEPQDYYVEPQYVGSNDQPVYIEPQYEYEYSQPSEQEPEVIEAVFVGQPQTSTDIIATTVVPKGLYTEDKYDALKQYNGQEVYAVDSTNRTLRGVLNTDTMIVFNQNPNAPIQALDVRQAKIIRLVVGNKTILEPPVKRVKKLTIPQEGLKKGVSIASVVAGLKDTTTPPAPISAPVNVEAVKKNNIIRSNIKKGGIDLTSLG